MSFQRKSRGFGNRGFGKRKRAGLRGSASDPESPVDPDLPAEADRAADPSRVYSAALSLLGRRDFCSGELRRKLLDDGYASEAVETVVEELVAGRSVNDARYAENYVSYHAGRGHGPVRIAADLKALGLPSELIRPALDAGPDWRAKAREVRIRRFGSEEPAGWTEKAKQGRFLQYRGFSSDHIRAALGPDFDPDDQHLE